MDMSRGAWGEANTCHEQISFYNGLRLVMG